MVYEKVKNVFKIITLRKYPVCSFIYSLFKWYCVKSKPSSCAITNKEISLYDPIHYSLSLHDNTLDGILLPNKPYWHIITCFIKNHIFINNHIMVILCIVTYLHIHWIFPFDINFYEQPFGRTFRMPILNRWYLNMKVQL